MELDIQDWFGDRGVCVIRLRCDFSCGNQGKSCEAPQLNSLHNPARTTAALQGLAVGPLPLSVVSERYRDSDSRRPLRLIRDYVSQRALRRLDRKRRASRVSLRAEPSNHGTPSVVLDELPGFRFLIKGSVAGGAIYLVYDQELLGPSDKSQAALQKAEEVVPTAMYQFSQYVCEQTGLKIPQLPAPPKFNFHIRESWNSGIITMMSALSVAPSKAWEYSKEGWEYLKERTK
ncbi:hypothetical protein CB1_000320049 [Camelus ferus]|nr:hypothetical protein CB1_000320049 [Camelus ferus]